MEAGKKRLAGDTARAATTDEVKDLRREARDLKEVVAEHNQKALEVRHGYENRNRTSGAGGFRCGGRAPDCVEWLAGVQAQALAEGVQVDAEAAQVAAALDRARKLAV